MLLLSSMIHTYKISGATWQKGQKRRKNRGKQKNSKAKENPRKQEKTRERKPTPFSIDRKSSGSTMGFPVGYCGNA